MIWKEWLDSHLFTPSELESLDACPFGFYLKGYLKLTPPPPADPQLNPAEQGVIVHRILQKLFASRHLDKNRLDELIDAEFLGLHNRPQLIPVLVERQREAIRRALNAVLDREATKPAGGLQPAYFEWSFGHGDVPPLEIQAGTRRLRIRGRIDRIDVDHRHKSFLVVDYKTGSRKQTGQAIERGGSLQLPLYILAVESLLLKGYRAAGGIYYHLSDLSFDSGILHADRIPSGIDPRPGSIIPAARWERLFENIREKIAGLLGHIQQIPLPEPDRCEPWCPFKSLCEVRAAYPPAT